MEEGLKLLFSFSANAEMVIAPQNGSLPLSPSLIPMSFAKLFVSLTAVVKAWTEDKSLGKLKDFLFRFIFLELKLNCLHYHLFIYTAFLSRALLCLMIK